MAKNKSTKKGFGDLELALVNIVILLMLLVTMIPTGWWASMAVICVLMLLNIVWMTVDAVKGNAKDADAGHMDNTEQAQAE